MKTLFKKINKYEVNVQCFVVIISTRQIKIKNKIKTQIIYFERGALYTISLYILAVDLSFIVEEGVILWNLLGASKSVPALL